MSLTSYRAAPPREQVDAYVVLSSPLWQGMIWRIFVENRSVSKLFKNVPILNSLEMSPFHSLSLCFCFFFLRPSSPPNRLPSFRFSNACSAVKWNPSSEARRMQRNGRTGPAAPACLTAPPSSLGGLQTSLSSNDPSQPLCQSFPTNF